VRAFEWVKLLAAVLVVAAGTGCGPSLRQQPADVTTGGGQTAAPASQPPAQPMLPAVDELDVAIRDASDYLNEKVPKGNKIVILNVHAASTDLSDYIIDELIANAVNDGFFTVVDRQQLDAIRDEQKFQMSGAVDDRDAQAIGKFFGAQIVVSGAVNRLGATGYRIRIRALEVQTAQVIGQYNRNIASSATMNSLMANVSPAGGSHAASGSAAPAATATPTTQAIAPASGKTTPAEPPVQGTAVPGENLLEKLLWLQKSAESHNTYIVEVNADETISPHKLEYSGGINITIAIRGDNVNRTIRLSSNGALFTIRPEVTLILENNIAFQGHSRNNNTLVHVDGGTLIMKTGAAITGNSNPANNTYGHGVYMSNGTFTMNGGAISGNGVNSGSESGGGGVCVGGGTLTMKNGVISGNACEYGGGVFVASNGILEINGGTISGNTAKKKGGGVFVNHSFTMKNGSITGNTAGEYGGGVFVQHGGWLDDVTFNKTRGTVTGYSSDRSDGNVVKDEDGNILARRGHAAFVDENTRKETTAGPGVNLYFHRRVRFGADVSGAWDQ